jgi:hypothetical protein
MTAQLALDLATEEWRPVVGHEGRYAVSDQGRVRSLDRVIVDSEGRHRRWRGRILSAAILSTGYLAVTLPGPRTSAVHALVLAAFVGPRPDGMYCLHNNGDQTDNRACNLRYGTASENSIDTILHGNNPRSQKTECLHGHAFTRENTLIVAGTNGRTWRHCRACRDRRNAARFRSKSVVAL